ncbi:hypothetical protein MG293_002187 [Ovis ammon polii]|uniref:Uncharacterized protein n=1 Tax=Ovis ammon polii TaxID=230172 RepID=A0AAD4UNN2_OVIAM|nr:hypothetical protein MG293_002187 [Ovis ammon polii]KAI4580374.1 hypothetical protein MJT46_001742 [Ovis ammon polii x Ovis aries]
MDMGTQGSGRKRLPNRERLTAEDDALNQIAREQGKAEKATGPGQEEARSGATTPDQALFLRSAVTPNTGLYRVAANRASVYFLGTCSAVSVLIGLLSCPVFLQHKHTLTKLLSPYCLPSCRASNGGRNGRPGLV